MQGWLSKEHNRTLQQIQKVVKTMKLENSAEPISNLSDSNQDGTCVANINAAGRRRRLIFGIVQFVIATAVLGVLVSVGVDRLWRLPVFLLFFAASVGIFQWRDKTCVALAKLGTREVNNGTEEIKDQNELSQVRQQARKVMIKAFLTAVFLTLLALAYPG